jgi:hypothetical protein
VFASPLMGLLILELKERYTIGIVQRPRKTATRQYVEGVFSRL